MLAAARIIDKENPYINKNRAKAIAKNLAPAKKIPVQSQQELTYFEKLTCLW
jgi:hypothetical protein